MAYFEKGKNLILNRLMKNVNECLRDVSEEVDKKTPEDTFQLITHNKTDWASIQPGKITGRVYNDDEKAKYVEYGQDGKVFNYYKDGQRVKGGSPFHIGVGARMFESTAQENKEKILTKLKNIG